MHLVLVGTPHVPIPKHPRIHHLGFLEDQDKYDAMAAAELLIMPSYLESLSMVALEAWAMGKPVLANAKCDVLQGQCIRSNAGLFYDNFHEFAETMRAIDAGSQPAGRPWPQRPRLLRAQLRVAGDREEVRRHAGTAVEGDAVADDGAHAGLVHAPAPLAAACRQRREAVAGGSPIAGSREVRSQK